jgi:hypothetical protein
MRSANLISCNTAGVITTTSLLYDDYDEGEIIQLTIGEFRYKFNNEGKLITTDPNSQGVCVNNNSHIFSCAQPTLAGTCMPLNFKTED